jgi:hypothetical protein
MSRVASVERVPASLLPRRPLWVSPKTRRRHVRGEATTTARTHRRRHRRPLSSRRVVSTTAL